MSDYNPNSIDSRLSTILTRLDNQDEILHRIDGRGEKQDERIKKLEDWKLSSQVATGSIATVFSVAGTVLWNWLSTKK